jgi:hypothetical protein
MPVVKPFPMPRRPPVLWVAVKGDRLFASRGIPARG